MRLSWRLICDSGSNRSDDDDDDDDDDGDDDDDDDDDDDVDDVDVGSFMAQDNLRTFRLRSNSSSESGTGAGGGSGSVVAWSASSVMAERLIDFLMLNLICLCRVLTTGGGVRSGRFLFVLEDRFV